MQNDDKKTQIKMQTENYKYQAAIKWTPRAI